VKPSVAISMGDPLGIGPEVVVAAIADPRVRAACLPLVCGDTATLERAARLRGVPLECAIAESGTVREPVDARAAGWIALSCIGNAARLVQQGAAHALCTAPVSKERVAQSAPEFVGHTEHLAALTGARVAMMMAGPRLRVVLATTHLALADVPRKLTAEQIAFVTTLAARELRRVRAAVARARPEAIAIGLLHGYAFAGHERRLARALGMDKADEE